MVLLATQETKLCCVCGRQTPFDGFPWKKREAGTRHSQCRLCYVEYHRNYRCQRKAKRIDGYVAQVARAPTSNRMAAICHGMAAQFGGMDRLCREWKRQIELKPGSAASLRSFSAIARMIKACSDSPQPKVAQLTDAELAEEIASLGFRMVQDTPELAVAALRRAGWQVSPPDPAPAG